MSHVSFLNIPLFGYPVRSSGHWRSVFGIGTEKVIRVGGPPVSHLTEVDNQIPLNIVSPDGMRTLGSRIE
jgi:hypothetical protein